MKTRNLQLIIFLAVIFFWAERTFAAEWIFLESVSTGAQYYKQSSVKAVDKNIMRVWVKEIYNDNGKIKNFSFLKTINKKPINPYILSHELKLIEINCEKEKIRGCADSIYDKQGNVIAEIPDSYYARKDFVSKSVYEKIINTVCNANKPSDHKKRSGIFN